MSYANQAHFNNYDPSSFGWPRHAALVPFTFGGVNFGLVARDAKPVFEALLTELVPHIPGGLKKGSCWCYSATDDLPDGSWSFHHYGIAIDVNWNVNKMGTNIPDAHGRWAIPRDVATRLAAKYGCEWGGNWSGGFHDDMHFEVHLSPGVARTVSLVKPPPPPPPPAPKPQEDDVSAADVITALGSEEGQALLTQAVKPFFHDREGKQVSDDTIIAERLTPILTELKQLTAAIDALAAKAGAA